MKEYQLRRAAGVYWLLAMNQSGKEYRRPLALNESGALIWTAIEQGKTKEVIAEEFKERFSLSKEEALADIESFLEELRVYGIVI